MTTLSGRCLCGAVTWQTPARPIWAGHCHCESCRRACSAPFTSFLGVPRDSVNWSGRVAVNASSHGARRGYCPSCGAQLYYQGARWPAETHLHAATLDDPSLFRPEAHFHYAERAPWLGIDDNLPKYAGTDDDGAEPP